MPSTVRGSPCPVHPRRSRVSCRPLPPDRRDRALHQWHTLPMDRLVPRGGFNLYPTMRSPRKARKDTKRRGCDSLTTHPAGDPRFSPILSCFSCLSWISVPFLGSMRAILFRDRKFPPEEFDAIRLHPHGGAHACGQPQPNQHGARNPHRYLPPHTV